MSKGIPVFWVYTHVIPLDNVSVYSFVVLVYLLGSNLFLPQCHILQFHLSHCFQCFHQSHYFLHFPLSHYFPSQFPLMVGSVSQCLVLTVVFVASIPS